MVCVSSCPWPNAFYVDFQYSTNSTFCSPSCPVGTFLSRDTQDCLSTCGYRNATEVNGNTICEDPGDATYCPFLERKQSGDSFLTCVNSCNSTALIFTNGSFQECVFSCPTAAKFILTDQKHCGTTCASGFFQYNISRQNPMCISSCPFPLTKIKNATYNNYYDCEVSC